MSIELREGVIHVLGEGRVEDAETLFTLLQADRSPPVDVGECRHLHAALVQVLLGCAATVCGTPSDGFLRALGLPNLQPTISSTKSCA